MVYAERMWSCKEKWGETKTHRHKPPWHLPAKPLFPERADKGQLDFFLYAACLQMTLELNTPFHLGDRNMIP